MTPKQEAALRLALEGAANYIDVLGGDSRKYRQALAEQPHCDDCGGFDPECPLAQPAQQEPVANREDVIRMAREAGIVFDDKAAPFYERFAALVAAYVRETEFKPDWNKYQQGLADGAAAEREACAKVCEEKQEYSMPIPCPDGISGCLVAHYVSARREKTGDECAAAIRARGNT